MNEVVVAILYLDHKLFDLVVLGSHIFDGEFH